MSLNYLDEQKCVPLKGLSKIIFQNLSTSFGPEKKNLYTPSTAIDSNSNYKYLFYLYKQGIVVDLSKPNELTIS